MSEVISSKKIELLNINNTKCIRINFNGLLKYEHSLAICNEWKKIALQNKNIHYNLILNAKDMSNYDPLARATFQKTLTEFKDSIQKIWLITDSKIISGGASLINITTSMPIHMVSSENEIDI